ncbi:MAG: transcriptional regulator [Solirubrobacterales bacterium]|nr:transcriptional regulator [Solirubrobacterales bacterium]
MTEPKFDELIHQSTRLSIMGLLAAADWADFAFLREELGMSDSALSKQLSTLEAAGYVTIDRPVSDHRRRVRASLTQPGMAAFQGHVAALRRIVEGADTQPLLAPQSK